MAVYLCCSFIELFAVVLLVSVFVGFQLVSIIFRVAMHSVELLIKVKVNKCLYFAWSSKNNKHLARSSTWWLFLTLFFCLPLFRFLSDSFFLLSVHFLLLSHFIDRMEFKTLVNLFDWYIQTQMQVNRSTLIPFRHFFRTRFCRVCTNEIENEWAHQSSRGIKSIEQIGLLN